MGAVFSSLYREIHYIQVHYIKVWVYNYSKVSIVLFCKAKFLCVTVSCEEFLLLVPTLFASLKSIVRRFERVSPSPQLHTLNQSRVEHSSSHIVTHYIFHKQYILRTIRLITPLDFSQNFTKVGKPIIWVFFVNTKCNEDKISTLKPWYNEPWYSELNPVPILRIC